MTIWKGKAISPGYARGQAVVYRLGRGLSAPQRRIARTEVEAELGRFRAAIEATAEDLAAARRLVALEVGPTEAAVFDAHATILRDEALRRKVEGLVTGDLVNAERAVEAGLEEIAARLASIGDAYLRERADDVRDLSRRLLAHFPGAAVAELPHLPPDSVLVAAELLPSDTVRLDRRNVRAILTERCGRTSHAAILAKALGIPAVSDLHAVCERIRTGTELLIDGVSGVVIVGPDADQAQRFAGERSRYEERLATAQGLSRGCVTRDDVRIELHANLGRTDEVGEVAARGLDGIGLFRTEILFLHALRPPTFEEQREAYHQVARELNGLPMIIRTLDLGGDKRPDFLPAPSDRNPTLGLRGLRFALKQSELLRTQLRAIVDVAAEFPLRVLFPMVLGGGDLAAAIDVLKSVASEAGARQLPPVGAMIETPASLFALDEILRRADFLSLGTNDLTQFMLAADRDAVELIDDYSMLHPSLLRAIRDVVRRASAVGKPVSVCGEAAGDPVLVPVLAGLGVRQLSMSPARAPAVRLALRDTDVGEATRLADDLLGLESLELIRARVVGAPSREA